MRKRKKKFKKIVILCLIALLFFAYFHYDYIFETFLSPSSDYNIIHQAENQNYAGGGQTRISNQDGYFTTFTTSGKSPKTYKEYKQNGSASWQDKFYWGGTMRENGCGITALSIILSGYQKEVSPEDLRKKYQPVLKAEKISTELSKSFGIENSDFYFDSIHLSEKSIINHLQTNRPILICVWDKPQKNRWTEKSHYMVLLATDGEKVYVSNPNGGKNDAKSSGWYAIEEITPYLAKALYIESYE